jgi:transcriptional regulator with XRE-family HTH domain
MNASDPRIALWLELGRFLFEAGELGAGRLHKRLRRRRRASYSTRRPGAETPLWNRCASALRAELKPHGAKVRLARYLGIPKQRITDFLSGRRRMPDAELTLQLLCWLAEKRSGRDPSM